MVCEDLSLNWNDHPRALVGVFEKLFEEGTLVDCTIAAEGQYVKAHKVILSACSPYFEMLFTQESEKNPIIILKDVKFRELKAMIEFIYRGKVKIPEDRLQDFVDAAESLQIKGLGVDQTKNNSEKRRNEFENVGGKRDGTTPHKRIKNSSLNINEGSSHHLPPERLTVYENITRESHLSSKTDLSISTSSPTVSSLCVSDTPTCVNSTLTGQRNPVENLTQSNEVTEAESVIKTELQPVVGVFLPESDCLVDPKKEVCEEELIIDNNEEVEEPFAEHIRHEESVEQFSSFPLVEESSLGAEESYTLQQMDDSNTDNPVSTLFMKDAEEAMSNLMPEKSKERYMKEWESFQEWKEKNKVSAITEGIMLAYFEQKSKVVKSSTLWSIYSMLKRTMNLKENFDISRFKMLTSFIKQSNIGYEAKKAKTLTREELNKFFLEAPDEVYLMIKVATLIGVAGACRRDELHKMSIDDVEVQGNVLVVRIKNATTLKERVFTIVPDGLLNHIDMFRKYIALRPKNVHHRKLFLFYSKGRCSVQPVGIHAISKMPKIIAEYLGLPEAKEYTGHCFRKTSATLLANSGGDLSNLNRRVGWRSSVTEDYLEDTVGNSIKVAKRISCEDQSNSSSRNIPSTNVPQISRVPILP